MRKKHSETGCVNSALMTSQYDRNYSELFAPEHYLGLEMIRRHCSLPVEDPRLFCGLWLQNTTFDSNNETNLKILNLKLLFVKEFSLNFGIVIWNFTKYSIKLKFFVRKCFKKEK